jgi:ABC-2 type transport system permease protein
MRTIGYIIQKEFTQIFRDKMMVRIIFFIPLVQLLVLAYAVTFEIKQIRLVSFDQDRSPYTARLINKFSGSPFIEYLGNTDSYQEAEQMILSDKADQILVFKADFGKEMNLHQQASVQVITNAINGNAAGLMNAYATSIINDFNREIIVNLYPTALAGLPIEIIPSFWYNPEMDYITFMVPGILVLLVTLIGMFLTSMNLVKEKEIGTIEQINVTPIRKIQFIAGKLIPFWIIANVDFAIGLIIAKLIFNIPIVGSLPLLFFVVSVYLVVVLSFGLFISTVSHTIQQAMFITWFFVMVFILMSGLFTPIESMPQWAQVVDYINPVAYFIRINRMVMLKGSDFIDIQRDFWILAFYGMIMFTFATRRYRKTT